MNTHELREAYLSFFEGKGCVRRPSDVLAPNDPSVLFTPAGMNQFKEQFLGIGALEFTRATTCQKCIRTGDIENVGKTRFHMTFFEMLGNFSFGDYFKREAIHWAWEFVTRVLRMSPESLRVSVYERDEEAHDIWRDEIKLPTSKIRRCGEDDNFWPAGAPTHGPDGVCGPCSEIFADVGNGNEVEIWNLVFTQFNRVGVNKLEPLPKKNIDTGMGLERTAAVLQGVPTAFDIDLFQPILKAASDALRIAYDPTKDSSRRLRRIADHVRCVTFCMHENILPSNEKQGYMVRRLLRRAVLDAYQLGVREPVIHQLVPAVVEAMQGPYPEIKQTVKTVVTRIKTEEERFLNTVETGINYLDQLLARLEGRSGGVINGKEAFTLHATHGFPVELTEELAASRNIGVDRAGFDQEMKRHSEISGQGAFSEAVFHVGPIQELKDFLSPTDYVGDRVEESPATIKAIIAQGKLVRSLIEIGHDRPVTVVLERTPFYGESGGQVGDTGTLVGEGFLFDVIDTHKSDGYHLHIGHVRQGQAKVGQSVIARIDGVRRAGIRRAHSATHVLHAALHQVLGEHAKQAGSKVENDVLRFDFSHPRAVTEDERRRIEDWANERVMESAPIEIEIKPIAQAKAEGAMALFGEKYGDQVRVVSMGSFSKEFCGGSHLSNTGQVGPLRIIREESVAAGVRRLVALTGAAARAHIAQESQLLKDASATLKAPPAELPHRIEQLLKEIRDLKAELKQRRAGGERGDQLESLLKQADSLSGATLLVAETKGISLDEMRALSDQLRSKRTPLALLLGSRDDGRVDLLASVTPDLASRGLHAGKWIGEVAQVVEGKGGGRETMAQAGGKNPSLLPQALDRAKEIARKALGASN